MFVQVPDADRLAALVARRPSRRRRSRARRARAMSATGRPCRSRRRRRRASPSGTSWLAVDEHRRSRSRAPGRTGRARARGRRTRRRTSAGRRGPRGRPRAPRRDRDSTGRVSPTANAYSRIFSRPTAYVVDGVLLSDHGVADAHGGSVPDRRRRPGSDDDRHRAAVDRPGRAGDVGGALRAQEGDHVGDLLIGPEATQRVRAATPASTSVTRGRARRGA